MVIETASSPGPFRNTQMSKAAQTHKLRKLRAPSKCRECDSLVVFHGAECEEVTLVSFSPTFCFQLMDHNATRPRSATVFGPSLNARHSEYDKFEAKHLPGSHNGFFIAHGEQKSNTNKRRGTTSSLIKKLRIKGEAETGCRVPSEAQSSSWSRSGDGWWKLRTFCSGAEEWPPSPSCPLQFMLDPVPFHIYSMY